MPQICLFCGREVDMGASSVRELYRIRRGILAEILQDIRALYDRKIELSEQYGGVKKQGLLHEASAYAQIIKMLEAMLKEVDNEND